MGKNKTNNIFEHFGEQAIDPAKADVVGIDFGDGELAVVRMSVDSSTGELKRDKVHINNMGDDLEYAVLYYGKNWKNEDVIELGRTSQTRKDGTHYANYKVLPERASETYNGTTSGGKIILDDSSPSYKELMGKAFAKLIEEILENNKETFRQHNDMYLFVGRPSSTCWAEEAKDYRNILRSELKNDRKYHVLVISEALAAMANEYRKNRNLSGITVVIIDGGSSTFDCAVVRGGKILCEYSRQIGAGMLDKNLLDLYIFGEERIKDANGRVKSWSERQKERKEDYSRRDGNNKPLYNYSEGGDLMGVRGEKEAFYGPDGRDENESAAYNLLRTIEAKPKTMEYYELLAQHQAPIKSLINMAVNEMPVLVKSSYPPEENDSEHCGEDFEYESFADGVESFFRGAKAKWESVGANPEVVIVTGGATYMPFVGELMNKVFEPEKNGIQVMDERLGDRHYAVADGVAYMGYLELCKEQIYREVCAETDKILKDNESSIKDAALDSYVSFRWDVMKKSMQKWNRTDKYHTLDDYFDRIHRFVTENLRAYEKMYPNDIVVLVNATWEKRLVTDLEKHLNKTDGVIEKINQMLQKRTEKLFGRKNSWGIKLEPCDLSEVGNYNPTIFFDLRLFIGNLWQRIRQGLPLTMNTKKYLAKDDKTKILNNLLNNETEVRKSIRDTSNSYFAENKIYADINQHLIDNAHAFVRKYVDSLTEYMIMEDFHVD